MPEGGAITITAERVASKVIVRIADTGPGIPRSHSRPAVSAVCYGTAKTGWGWGSRYRGRRRAPMAEIFGWRMRRAPGPVFASVFPWLRRNPPPAIESAPDSGSGRSHQLMPGRG